jgi:hypothetical protein
MTLWRLEILSCRTYVRSYGAVHGELQNRCLARFKLISPLTTPTRGGGEDLYSGVMVGSCIREADMTLWRLEILSCRVGARSYIAVHGELQNRCLARCKLISPLTIPNLSETQPIATMDLV